jgi:hypothetical protein
MVGIGGCSRVERKMATLLGSADLEHLGATHRALALLSGLAVLHGDGFHISGFSLLFALQTIGFHTLGLALRVTEVSDVTARALSGYLKESGQNNEHNQNTDSFTHPRPGMSHDGVPKTVSVCEEGVTKKEGAGLSASALLRAL